MSSGIDSSPRMPTSWLLLRLACRIDRSWVFPQPAREALCELLRPGGDAPSTARDGAEALERLQSSPVPLLISELETPRLGVLDLLPAIQHPRLPAARGGLT